MKSYINLWLLKQKRIVLRVITVYNLQLWVEMAEKLKEARLKKKNSWLFWQENRYCSSIINQKSSSRQIARRKRNWWGGGRWKRCLVSPPPFPFPCAKSHEKNARTRKCVLAFLSRRTIFVVLLRLKRLLFLLGGPFDSATIIHSI